MYSRYIGETFHSTCNPKKKDGILFEWWTLLVGSIYHDQALFLVHLAYSCVRFVVDSVNFLALGCHTNTDLWVYYKPERSDTSY